MKSGCPGNEFRKLKIEVAVCPSCAIEIEMFSDELIVRCPGCGSKISREFPPSCVDWCSSAKSCLGESRW